MPSPESLSPVDMPAILAPAGKKGMNGHNLRIRSYGITETDINLHRDTRLAEVGSDLDSDAAIHPIFLDFLGGDRIGWELKPIVA